MTSPVFMFLSVDLFNDIEVGSTFSFESNSYKKISEDEAMDVITLEKHFIDIQCETKQYYNCNFLF